MRKLLICIFISCKQCSLLVCIDKYKFRFHMKHSHLASHLGYNASRLTVCMTQTLGVCVCQQTRHALKTLSSLVCVRVRMCVYVFVYHLQHRPSV